MVVKIGKEIFKDDFKKGDYLKRLKQKGTTKDLTKYKVKKIKVDIDKKAIGGPAKTKKGSTDFGMLSVKAGIDNNPNETRADFIAGATKGRSKKPQGAFIGKIFQNQLTDMFARLKADTAIQDPEAYRQAYNKYATAYGNEPMKGDEDKKVQAKNGKFIVRGMGAAIRGGSTKGSS